MSKAREIAELGQKLTVDGSGNLDIAGSVETDGALKVGSGSTLFGAADSGLNHFSNNYMYLAGGSNGTIIKSKGLATEYAKFEGGAITFNEDSNDMDFRVESDSNTHNLFLDAGTGRIGIRTASPAYTLDVVGDVALSAATSLVGKGGVGGDTQLLYWQGTTAFYGRNSLGGSVTNHEFRSGGTTRLSVNSGEVVVNDTSGADYDFRVEGDTEEHMLFVDASTNRVGIAQDSPTAKLHVNSQDVGSVTNLIVSQLGNTNGTSYVSQEFKFNEGGVPGAKLMAGKNSSAGSDFYIYTGQAANGAYVQRMKIAGGTTTTGSVVFNEDSYNQDFRVESDTNTHALFVDAGAGKVKINSSLATDGVLLVKGADNAHPVITVSGANTNGYTLFADRYQADESILNIGLGYSGANPTFSRSCKPSTTTESAFISSQDTFNAQPAALEIKNDGFRFYHTRTNATTATDSAVTLTNFFHISGDGVIANDAGTADADFRVESDSRSNAFLVDAGAEIVGVNPSINYTMSSTSCTAFSVGDFVTVTRNKAVPVSSSNLELIKFARNQYNHTVAGTLLIVFRDTVYPTGNVSMLYNIATYGANGTNITIDLNQVDVAYRNSGSAFAVPTIDAVNSTDDYIIVRISTNSSTGGTAFVKFDGWTNTTIS